MKERTMKKTTRIAFVLAMTVLMAAVLSSCADASGLHDQKAASVTFVFENFGEKITGEYSIPGNFNEWDNSKMMVSMSKGSGTSSPVTVSEANIQFSLVKVKEWTREWFADFQGNGFDNKDQKYHNFYIDGLDLSSGEITLVIDGTLTGTAMVYVK